jgi:uncharacterized protein involved in outer membrane biogenesis
MRRLLIIISIAVVAILVLLVAGASLLNINRYRPQIQSELQKKLGRSVTLGELHLRLLPFAIKVDGLTIAELPSIPSSHPFVAAKEVYASASLMSLIRGEPQIKELTLQNPQVELIRNAAGIWNASNLGSGESGSTSSSSQGAFTLNELKVIDGQLAVTDQRTKSPRTVYNHIDLTLAGFAPGKSFDLDAAVHFPGSGKELLSFQGKAGPLPSSGTTAFPVNGHLSLQQISLAGVNTVSAGAIPPHTDASVSGDAEISSQAEAMACRGTLELQNAVVQGAKVSYPIDARYDLKLNQKTNEIGISSATIKMGPTAVSLAGTIDSGVTPSHLNVRLQTTNASIVELSRLGGLFGVAFDNNDQVKGSLSADLTVSGVLTSPQVQGTLSSTGIQAQDIALSNVHATARMQNGIVDLAPVTAGAFGGQADGTISLNTKAAHPLCTVKTKLNGVDTNALLSAVSSLKDTLYGKLAADSDLSFAVDASTNVARTLNGVLNFNVANGHLKNINILNELARVGKFLNSAAAQKASGTDLQKFSGTLNVKDGLATTNNLVAVMNEGSLSANGALNLVDQGIDMHMTAVLSNGISSAVGGTSVGGFLNSALANNKGELVLPVLVTGSMAHPTFMPDVQAIAKMKMTHLVPTLSDPSKGVGALLGGAAGQSPGQQKGSQTQNAVDSLLKQFGKKKK